MENSKIQWCDHSWNPWVGCQKVSDGCKYCYAEVLMTRKGRWANTWGPPETSTRVRTSEANWRKPLKWNDERWVECQTCGWRGPQNKMEVLYSHGRRGGLRNRCPECRDSEFIPTRQRVFCASLADIFEDNPTLDEWRLDLFRLIFDTPNLDWLILTKRPENVLPFIDDACWPETGCPMFDGCLPPNVWIGTSVEDQKSAGARISELVKISAAVRFLSIEPQLGPVDLGFVVDEPWMGGDAHGGREYQPALNLLDWAIIGGESGPEARVFDLAWAFNLVSQCQEAYVAPFVKQLGSNPIDGHSGQKSGYPVTGKGDKMAEWPPELRIREFPKARELALGGS